ncbi:unnamed protein product, partial [Mycena citricolor]
SSSSKAARSLPKRATATTPPPWSGARPVPRTEGVASETKTKVIEEDAQDPHFLSKLSQLGQVKVDHNMQTTRPATVASQMYKTRVQSETDAESPTPIRNRMPAPRLSLLLDQRKSVKTRRDMEFLAARYGLDLDMLDAVAKFVNTPSVQQSDMARSVGAADHKQILRAVWVEPTLKG